MACFRPCVQQGQRVGGSTHPENWINWQSFENCSMLGMRPVIFHLMLIWSGIPLLKRANIHSRLSGVGHMGRKAVVGNVKKTRSLSHPALIRHAMSCAGV